MMSGMRLFVSLEPPPEAVEHLGQAGHRADLVQQVGRRDQLPGLDRGALGEEPGEARQVQALEPRAEGLVHRDPEQVLDDLGLTAFLISAGNENGSTSHGVRTGSDPINGSERVRTGSDPMACSSALVPRAVGLQSRPTSRTALNNVESPENLRASVPLWPVTVESRKAVTPSPWQSYLRKSGLALPP